MSVKQPLDHETLLLLNSQAKVLLGQESSTGSCEGPEVPVDNGKWWLSVRCQHGYGVGSSVYCWVAVYCFVTVRIKCFGVGTVMLSV